ncbi:MAG: hypothetical protein HBSAPP03_25890 [Phycisphaerae bacterium]|nr:MAG: hypothetical protein HBSAPP03_25890 [Phycisphaerae bacterium]
MNRWIVSLHEAGHAVAALVLSGTRVVATLHENGGGAAWPLEELSPTDAAIMAAAGPLAEALADRHTAPEIPPPVASKEPCFPPALPTLESAATVETAGKLKRELAQAVSDHVVVARWCIAGIEKQPERWSQRHAWIQTLAKRLIRSHEKSIVEVARVLYQRGVVSVPLDERNAS